MIRPLTMHGPYPVKRQSPDNCQFVAFSFDDTNCQHMERIADEIEPHVFDTYRHWRCLLVEFSADILAAANLDATEFAAQLDGMVRRLLPV